MTTTWPFSGPVLGTRPKGCDIKPSLMTTTHFRRGPQSSRTLKRISTTLEFHKYSNTVAKVCRILKSHFPSKWVNIFSLVGSGKKSVGASDFGKGDGSTCCSTWAWPEVPYVPEMRDFWCGLWIFVGQYVEARKLSLTHVQKLGSIKLMYCI